MIEDLTDPLDPRQRYGYGNDAHAEAHREASILGGDGSIVGSDTEEIKKRRIEHAKNERERLEFVRGIMSLQCGRKWLWRLLQECRVNSELIVSGDTHLTYYQLGRRNVGMFLLQDLQRFPNHYLLMVSENQK